MNTEETALSLTPVQNLRLVALDPRQLQNSQQQLIGWCAGKIAEVQSEIRDLSENLRIALASNWKASIPKNHLAKAEGRLRFYMKIKDALEAGFFVIPNFPCDIFAIRTNRLGPDWNQKHIDSYSRAYGVGNEKGQILASGAGRYVDPNPEHQTFSRNIKVDGADKVENTVVVNGWKEDIDFPFVLAKPEVLSATQRAMALKIFDELGVCPQTKKSDPLVVGIIKAPKSGYSQKQVSFLVAWFLDTDTL